MDLRFFNVYGPTGRPDMARWLFSETAMNIQSIEVLNSGKIFCYYKNLEDIVESVIRIQVQPPGSETSYSLFNIGHNELIEAGTGKKAKKILYLQLGDVEFTYSDTTCLETTVATKPKLKSKTVLLSLQGDIKITQEFNTE